MREPTVQDRIESLLTDEIEERTTPEEAESAKAELSEEAEMVDEVEETEENQTSEEAEVEEVAITSLSDWAEHDGIGLEDAYSVTIPVSDSDGKTKHIPIGELKDSYQNSSAVRAVQEKLTQQMKAVEADAIKRKEEMDQHFFTAAKMVESIERSVIGELDTPQVQELRRSDPAEYAAIVAEHQQRMQSVTDMKQGLGKEWQQHKEREAEEQKAKQAEYLQKAKAVLPKLIPEWNDESQAKQEVPMIRDYGTQVGFAEPELAGIYDPRLIKVFRDAALYNKQLSAAPESKKKVVSIGKKVLKSGKSKSKTDRQADQFKQDRAKLGKSGDMKDAAALFEKHFLGDF